MTARSRSKTLCITVFPASVTAQPRAVMQAATSSVYVTATETFPNGDIVYAARARLPSDPALRRRTFPVPTGMSSGCAYPKRWCKGMNGRARCVDTNVDINGKYIVHSVFDSFADPASRLLDCGGCVFGSIVDDLVSGEDCTQTADDGVQCVEGRCLVDDAVY